MALKDSSVRHLWNCGSVYVCVCVCVCVCWRLCSVESNTLRSFQTAAHQAPLSLGFSRQEYWMGCRFPSKNNAYVLQMNEIKGERPDILHADLQIHKTCSQVYLLFYALSSIFYCDDWRREECLKSINHTMCYFSYEMIEKILM